MNLPRMVRQHVLHLRSQVKADNLSADDAGAKLLAHLKANWPLLADDILLRWCVGRFRACNPLPEGWVQQDLWPAWLWHLPLSEAIKYREQQHGITSRFGKRDRMRKAEEQLLIAAVGGNLTMTLEQAYRLAHPEEATG
jgi:hypothetical protein